MDLNSINDTPLLTTDSAFRKSVLASGIVKVLPELKSTSAKRTQGFAATAGLIAELQVARLLKTKKWQLTFHRLKTRIAEIDLVFEKGNQILLVEVKTLNSPWRAGQRLSSVQLNKLKMNRSVMSYFSGKKNIEALVAWVEKNNVITFCRLD
jgi:Holliday junction resolvase-like predicted endonuclease